MNLKVGSELGSYLRCPHTVKQLFQALKSDVRKKSLCCAKHNQYAKHPKAKGSGCMPPEKLQIDSGGIFTYQKQLNFCQRKVDSLSQLAINFLN